MEHIKNALYIFSYILMLAALLVISIFYRQVLASVLLIFLVILPFISLYAGYYGVRHIKITASLPTGDVTEGDELRLRLSIRNRSAVPMLRCILEYTYFNSYRPDDEKFSITLPGEIFADDTYTVCFKTSMPGIFSFDAGFLLISDPLHFHTFKIKNDIHVRCYVYPKTIQVPYVPLPMYEGEPADEVVSETGEVTRDIRQLREYRAGDRLKDIHWKASAQSGSLVTKEYEKSTDLMYLLLPEVKKGAEPQVLRRYFSLGKNMIMAGMGFRCSIYNPADRTFDYANVSDEDSLRESISEIMERESSDADVYAEFMNQNPESTGVIRICPEEIIST